MRQAQQSRHFKVQRRDDILARDRSNKPFLLGVLWRVVAETDRQDEAVAILLRQRKGRPHKEFRIVEERLARPALAAETPRTPRRYKVQRRVELTNRTRANKSRLVGVLWRTVCEVDRQTTAENLLLKQRMEFPRKTFRIVEEWPPGTEPRELRRVGLQSDFSNHD